MDISISEVTSFLRCRRMWDYSSTNRQGLKKIGSPKAIMNIGTLMHAAITAHSRGESGLDALYREVHTQKLKLVDQYTAIVGIAPSEEELAGLDEQYQLVQQLFTRYIQRYTDDLDFGPFELIDTERTFRVPVPGIEDAYLIGTLDRIFRHRTTGALHPGEIKTYARLPSYTSLQLRPQFVAYAWALKQLFPNDTINGAVLYDGIRRELPNPPKLLKSDTYSTANLGTTDYTTYLETVSPHDIRFDRTYGDVLEQLKARDAEAVTPFFARYTIGVFPSQIEQFGERLPTLFRDMQAADVYPNFMHTCEYDCSFRDLCNAQEYGEGVEYLKEIGYTSNLGSQSFMQRHGAEHEVGDDSY
jgi:hypothetical protein